jgi:hypothetical protein
MSRCYYTHISEPYPKHSNNVSEYEITISFRESSDIPRTVGFFLALGLDVVVSFAAKFFVSLSDQHNDVIMKITECGGVSVNRV